MKFASSVYNKIWDSNEGRQIVTQILNDPNLIRANHMFWAQKFKIDPKITPTNQEGEAVFISRMRRLSNGQLMSVRAPLGDSDPEDKKGLEYYSGVIPEFISTGFVETALERDYKENLFAQFGDQALVAEYATDVLQNKVDSANQTLSNMAAQLMSTGKILYTQGKTESLAVLKAEIPAENRINGGAVVWTDNTNCKLLDPIKEIYNDLKDKWGLDINMQLEIPYDVFNDCFLKNEQVIEWVRYFNSLNNVLLPQNLVVTKDMAMNAINTFEGLPKIVVIEEKQMDGLDTVVHGWADGIAVMRPIGYAGYIRHTTTKDVDLFTKYGNGVNSYSFSPALNGLATVRNSVIVNGNFKEWHTDLVLPAVPSLDEFLYHVIINTKAAD